MNDKFDKLAKGLAQSPIRLHALRRFGVGLGFLSPTLLCLAVVLQSTGPARGAQSADPPATLVSDHSPPVAREGALPSRGVHAAASPLAARGPRG